jgi:hypothetical protein
MNQEEELVFLLEAIHHGRLDFVHRDEKFMTNRFLATVGAVSIPIDITDQLWTEILFPGAD